MFDQLPALLAYSTLHPSAHYGSTRQSQILPLETRSHPFCPLQIQSNSFSPALPASPHTHPSRLHSSMLAPGALETPALLLRILGVPTLSYRLSFYTSQSLLFSTTLVVCTLCRLLSPDRCAARRCHPRRAHPRLWAFRRPCPFALCLQREPFPWAYALSLEAGCGSALCDSTQSSPSSCPSLAHTLVGRLHREIPTRRPSALDCLPKK